MYSRSACFSSTHHLFVGLILVIMEALIAACAEVPQSNLPPSASDLTLLKSARLCDEKNAFLQKMGGELQREAWGSGEELRVPQTRSASGAAESYFFDDDGLLVGALFAFPPGLDLKPYPVLRKTLSQLKPTVEFYLTGVTLPSRADLDSSALYMTGDEKTTTQYLIAGEVIDAVLLMASFSLDPYVALLSPYRQGFLGRIARSQKEKKMQPREGKGAEMKEPFPSLQQFARGQTNQLGYCDSRNYHRAADAYRKALVEGFTDKTWIAEAHHRLGLVLEAQGQLEQAKAEMQQSLVLRPNTPEVLNNLGTVFMKLGARDKAVAAFEKAVTLRPNYPIARYNLAEAYEAVNRKRAISEYETYLALVEGLPGEAPRAAQARERIKALRR
ncbi:MAG: hypothetical protein C4293_01905 [Nitrospiraceae bacterium]